MVDIYPIRVPIVGDHIIVRNRCADFKLSLNDVDLSWNASSGEEIASLCESFQLSAKLIDLVMSVMGSPLLPKVTICSDLGFKKCILTGVSKRSTQGTCLTILERESGDRVKEYPCDGGG